MTNYELVSAVVTGVFTIAGVIIGILSSRKFESKKIRKQFLLDAYAEVFSAYYAFFPLRTASELPRLLTAIEKAKLLCSEQSVKIMDSILLRIQQTWPKCDDCLELMKLLRESAQQDLK